MIHYDTISTTFGTAVTIVIYLNNHTFGLYKYLFENNFEKQMTESLGKHVFYLIFMSLPSLSLR